MCDFAMPIGSTYDIFSHIWLLCILHVGKYTIHRSYGIVSCSSSKRTMICAIVIYVHEPILCQWRSSHSPSTIVHLQ